MEDISELSLSRLQRALADGELTSSRLTAMYLQRIAGVRAPGGAPLNAVREVNPDALAIAAGLDRERREGRIRSPLHGIPILIKDNIGSADAMRTTAGVHALADLRTPFDAAVVRRLRAAGAVLLGKCNCPDFCDYMASTMPSGHSTTGGTVGHPYGMSYGRGGGSSTGVAAAVAASLAGAGVGSETQNSIQAPCANSSVVGIKPTVGLVSRAGMVPLAISQDTAGPIARSVRDAAMLLTVIAGPDIADTMTLSALGTPCADYAVHCVDGALAGARIGVARREFFGREGKALHDAVVYRAIAAMRAAGAVIVDPADIPSAPELMPLASRVFRSDFKVGLNAFLERCGDRTTMRSMRHIIEHNERHGALAIPYGQDLLLAADATAGDWSEAEYLADRARDIRLSRSEGIDRALAMHGLDAIVAPMDHASKITGKAGYPAVTVPCGYVDDGPGKGAPVGLTFIGAAWSEARLIGIAHAFEQCVAARRAPALPVA